jgi:hypothetical protein
MRKADGFDRPLFIEGHMSWEEVLAEFRALGGIAENVRLGQGRFGRGIFAIDPAAPVRLQAVETMLVPVADWELRDGQLRVKASSAAGARERDFYERFERDFGWGAGMREEMWQAQEAWSALPPAVVNALCTMGPFQDSHVRFAPPTAELCFYLYLRMRMISYQGQSYRMPLVELVNHSGTAPGYVLESGVAVAGKFEDEVLVRYSRADAWKRALVWGFAQTDPFAYSLALNVDVRQTRLTIDGNCEEVDVRGDIAFPRAEQRENELRLAFLQLGSMAAPDLPRAVARDVLGRSFDRVTADDTFDTVLRFNREKFHGLLRVLLAHRGPLIEMLEQAVLAQLDALAACAGARTL